MEYEFRSSSKNEKTTILLEDYGLTLRMGEKKEVISYAHIVAVRISKSSNHVFQIELIPDGHKPIVIPSQTYLENGAILDQWQGYSLFVRVIHHHLKDKSPAVYSYGGKWERLLQRALLCIILSLVLSASADYFGLGVMNTYLQAVILAVFGFMFLVIFSGERFPKSYKPTEIPVQYLP